MKRSIIMSFLVLFSFINSYLVVNTSDVYAKESKTNPRDRETKILTQELYRQEQVFNELRKASDQLYQQKQALEKRYKEKQAHLSVKKQEYQSLKQENDELKQKILNYEAQLYRLTQGKQ